MAGGAAIAATVLLCKPQHPCFHQMFYIDPMKRFRIIALASMAAALCGCTAQRKLPAAKWEELFNGKDLSGWTVKIKDHPLNDNYAQTFRVADGMLQVRYDGYDQFKRQYGHLYFNKPYSAYLLELEYRFVGQQATGGEGWALRNSGIMLHCQDPKTIAVEQDFPISLEMQFLGGNGKDARTTGNLCTPGTNVFLQDKLFTPHCVNSVSKTYHGDQWVRVQALVLGDSLVRHIINGDTVISYTKPQYDGRDPWVKKMGLPDGGPIKGGYISLQSESHPIDFRKVRILDLSAYMTSKEQLAGILAQLQ